MSSIQCVTHFTGCACHEAKRDAALASQRDLYEKVMNLLHETAGIERNGAAGLMGWLAGRLLDHA